MRFESLPTVPCKHCGRPLDHDHRSASIDTGLDSDECPNNVSCMIAVHGAESAIGEAYTALRMLRLRWAEREAVELADDEALRGAELFGRDWRRASFLRP